jgi:hypothetical protein
LRRRHDRAGLQRVVSRIPVAAEARLLTLRRSGVHRLVDRLSLLDDPCTGVPIPRAGSLRRDRRADAGDIGVETDFRDGHLRHDDLKKPLTSQL